MCKTYNPLSINYIFKIILLFENFKKVELVRLPSPTGPTCSFNVSRVELTWVLVSSNIVVGYYYAAVEICSIFPNLSSL